MIDNDAKLAAFLGRIQDTPWLALDTEADSLHAYPEKICLLQITTPSGDDLIDPLSNLSLHPLFQFFHVHELILHGADYDLRLLRKHHDFVPRAIFDTMLASRLLGVAQFGLNNLVAQFLGVLLDKGPQKADWARRPLTPRMEEYARNDTRHLKPLADKLRADLQAKGRLAWHQESCAQLVKDCAEPRPPDLEMVWRIRGAHVLSPRGLAVLREIWNWREREAIAANKPPYFVLRHESLIELAGRAADGLPFEPAIPPRFSDRRRSSLIESIHRGLAVPAADHPQHVRHEARRLTNSDKQRMADLQKIRDTRATELGIDPTLIASRAMLVDLAVDWDAAQPTLMSWQRELLK